MPFINIETKEYPLYEGDIRLIYPDMGSDFVLPSGFAQVLQEPVPQITSTQIAEPLPPELLENGTYISRFIVRDLSEKELARNADIKAQYGILS